MHKWFACMHAFVPHAFLLSLDIRREGRIPWKWNYGCEQSCGCLEPNFGALPGQQVFLTIELWAPTILQNLNWHTKPTNVHINRIPRNLQGMHILDNV